MIFMLPFYYVYDHYYLKYERYREYIRELRKRGIKLDRQIRTSVQLRDQKVMDAMEAVDNKVSYEEKYPIMSESV